MTCAPRARRGATATWLTRIRPCARSFGELSPNETGQVGRLRTLARDMNNPSLRADLQPPNLKKGSSKRDAGLPAIANKAVEGSRALWHVKEA